MCKSPRLYILKTLKYEIKHSKIPKEIKSTPPHPPRAAPAILSKDHWRRPEISQPNPPGLWSGVALDSHLPQSGEALLHQNCNIAALISGRAVWQPPTRQRQLAASFLRRATLHPWSGQPVSSSLLTNSTCSKSLLRKNCLPKHQATCWVVQGRSLSCVERTKQVLTNGLLAGFGLEISANEYLLGEHRRW